MDTHSDAVVALAKNRHNLADMLSASADGDLVYWNLPARKPLYVVNAHPYSVRGIAFANNRILSADTIFVSTGDDKKVNIWSLAKIKEQYEEVLAKSQVASDIGKGKALFKNFQTRATFASKHMLTGVDHSYSDDLFATGGAIVQVWTYERSSPLQTFEWGVDTVTKIKFNPSESNLIATVAMDRSVCLYDIRGNTALQRITLKNKSSAIAWNPYEPMNFVVVSVHVNQSIGE
jgi:WD repeat and SOF domain-containing protein 1